MTRIDFYILSDVDELAKQRFACRLACRAVAEGKRVHLRAPAEAGAALDDLLWDYPPDRFLPHARLGATSEDGEGSAPVTIGAPDDALGEASVLVNLASDVPESLANLARVSEIVLATERSAGRAKYRRYRERGYALFHHELDDWEAATARA